MTLLINGDTWLANINKLEDIDLVCERFVEF